MLKNTIFERYYRRNLKKDTLSSSTQMFMFLANSNAELSDTPRYEDVAVTDD